MSDTTRQTFGLYQKTCALDRMKCVKNGCVHTRRENMEHCCIRCSEGNGHGPLCASNKIVNSAHSRYYTIKGKGDGFGAQYQAIMSGIAYCEKTNSTYVHTPFQRIAHGCNASKANAFVGIHNKSQIGKCKIVSKKFLTKFIIAKTLPSITRKRC